MKKVLILVGVAILLVSAGVLLKNSPYQTVQQAQTTADSESIPKDCSGKALVTLTEGPYYKEGSPARRKISQEETPGTHLILKGYVFDIGCKPVANAWLDFWQADGNGNYDNVDYNLRGHQYTNEDGFFRLETVVPGQYSGRTQHIHFKVRKSTESPILTSQLFFPDGLNSTDSLFDESLVVEFGTDPDGSKYALYNIIVP